eukprot:GHVL01012978.1.p1 GENE.GHVL01012978.1~~GHVL01012978.1.p1  ORF type:complete len:512 (+),score=63.97 GHVL01012978.1:218-1753(+)
MMRVIGLVTFFASISANQINVNSTLAWGSGFEQQILTPGRIVNLQLVDHNGRNITSSGGEIFEVFIILRKYGEKNFRHQKLVLEDRGDGTYSTAYSIDRPVEYLHVAINEKKSNKPLKDSPWRFFHVDSDACDCPDEFDTFWEKYHCQENSQIDRSLERFKPFFKTSLVREGLEEIEKDSAACMIHYSIVNNTLYGEGHGPMQAFRKFFESIMLSLMRKTKLPNSELLLNLGDWPLANTTKVNYPVFSWCGDEQSSDIVLPTYKLVSGMVYWTVNEMPFKIDSNVFKLFGGWDNKKPVMLFRGRPSNPLRLELANRVESQKDRYSIEISKNEMDYYPSEDERLAHLNFPRKKVDRMPFLDFWKYKYLLSIDGTVAAYRMPALLSGDSLVFKQKSRYYEHFYSILKEFEHYIPLEKDLSDIDEKLDWALQHDDEARKIADSGRKFVRNNLTSESLYCYYAQVMTEYSKLLSPSIQQPPSDHKKIIYPSNSTDCKCLEKIGETKEDSKKRSEL